MNPLQPSQPLSEYVTFGREPYLLLRVWILQVLVIFGDVRVFRIVHPAVVDVIAAHQVVWVYLLESSVALAVLGLMVYKMGRLTFAARFREPRTLAASALGYLLLMSPVVLVVYPWPNLPPAPDGGVTLLEVTLSLLVTVNLGALLSVGMYVQFDHSRFPSETEIDERVSEWVDAFDWAEKADDAREKRERYNEFQARTDAVEEMLDATVTKQGAELEAEFDDWRAAFERRSLVSQEAIVQGHDANERLAEMHRRLDEITTRLTRLSE